MLIRVVLAFVLVFAATLAKATSVLPLYLDEIVGRSAVAFQGTCVENRTERDAQTGLVATYTTFDVEDTLKGNVGRTYTIKQIGGQVPGEAIHFRVQGVPRFDVGQSYVVFLPQPSSAGFSSPVGLSQGSFSVLPGAAGPEVTNGRDFKDMAARLDPSALPASAKSKLDGAGAVRRLGLDDFKQMVRRQVGGPSAPTRVLK